MRITLLILFCIPNFALAIGAEILDEHLLEKYGFTLSHDLNPIGDCHEFEVTLPNSIKFEDVGKKFFTSASYIEVIEESDNVYQLMNQGSKVPLKTDKDGEQLSIKYLCIAERDLNNSYININYHRKGGILMLLYIPLRQHITSGSRHGTAQSAAP